jgi:[protein-PII] uridylyltransferase
VLNASAAVQSFRASFLIDLIRMPDAGSPAALVMLRDRLAEQKARLQSLRDQARERYAGGAPGLQVAALICEMTDRLICELFAGVIDPLPDDVKALVARQTAIVAIGGTGRGELAPYSDVDLLFLHVPRADPHLTECIAQAVRDCWDAGLKLGHSVWTPAGALAAAAVDPQFTTALVEARLVWGDERLFETFKSRFRRRVGRRHYAEFYRTVVAARQAERSQYGETERQLEPDVKRSPGGLRDIHLIRWIGFARYGTTELDLLRLEGALSRDDEQALNAAQEFITRVRVDLHFAAGKAQEVLTRDEQLRLADLHGVAGAAGQRPVERFMQTYFRHSTAVADISARFVERHRPNPLSARIWQNLLSHRSNHIFRVSADEIDVIPRYGERVGASLESLLNVFELAGLYSVRVSPDLFELIRQAVPKTAPELSSTGAQQFLAILRSTGQVGRQLRGMYRSGLLELILPEMSHARCLLQFNQYHAYTVDEHSLRAVEAAEQFDNDPGPVGVAYRTIKNKELLHLALLLHDLGKGFAEDHSLVGGDIARRVATRLGLSAHHTEMLVFLVLKHLAMAHLAFRRDLSDDEMLVRFSRDVGSPEVLRMLFVLTAADMTAVGPGTWTNWKAELLGEMFERTLQILSGAPPKFREAERVRSIAGQVHALLEAPGSGKEPDVARRVPPYSDPVDAADPDQRPLYDNQFDSLPLHYLTATAPAQIARDLVALRQLGPDDLIVRGSFESGTGTVEYRVITRDTVGSGLFHKVTGALTAKGLEILSANICTTPDGIVIDSFHVHDGDYAGTIPEFRLRDVESAVVEVITGQTTVEHLFQRHRRFVPTGTPRLFHEPSRVVTDNDSSERFTVIDVFADDRRGLLYTIASTLLELGLSVSLAKISTRIDQVVDVFYVTDRDGSKIQSEQRLMEIQAMLTGRIEEFERRGLIPVPVAK